MGSVYADARRRLGSVRTGLVAAIGAAFLDGQPARRPPAPSDPLPAPRPHQQVLSGEAGALAPEPHGHIFRGEEDPERAGRPRLVVVTDGKALAGSPEALGLNEDLLLRYGECTIGRGPQADIRLTDPMVSPLHGAFRRVAREDWDIVTYHDLGSLNGTSLNGVPILDAELADGDRLELGSTPLVFRRDKNAP